MYAQPKVNLISIDASIITDLKHDEQIELIQLSTQILYKLMDSNRIIEDALDKLNKIKTLEIKL